MNHSSAFAGFTLIAALAVSALSWRLLAEDDGAEIAERNLYVQNTTSTAIDVYLVDNEEREDRYVPGLAVGDQCTLSTYPGSRWRFKSGQKVLGDYLADENAEQEVDVAELASWQRPVALTILNTTDDPVDILFVDSNGEAKVVMPLLGAGKQFAAEANPGGLWRILRGGATVAEFITDNSPEQKIDVQGMIADYRQTLSLILKNTSDQEVDVYWVEPGGAESLFASIPAGKQHEQECYPGQVWTIRGGGEFKFAYAASEAIEQTIDIQALFDSLQESLAAEQPSANEPASSGKKLNGKKK